MTTLPIDICKEIARIRREKGVTQAALAQEVGCKQSAISMLEAGQTSKLSKENIEKIATVLGLTIQVPSPVIVAVPEKRQGYCPNALCPSNTPYLVQDQLLFHPRLQQSKHCVHCGELTETRCPACKAPLTEGACCPACGELRVTNTLPPETDLPTWIASRRRELTELWQLTGRAGSGG